MGEAPTVGGCLGFEDDCHWPVVGDIHEHVSAEAALLHSEPELTQVMSHLLNQRLGHFRGGSLYEAGSAALSGVGQKSELGNHQDLGTHVPGRQVELAGVVGEDAQPSYSIGQYPRRLLRVSLADTYQRHQPWPDLGDALAFHAHRGTADTLENRSQLLAALAGSDLLSFFPPLSPLLPSPLEELEPEAELEAPEEGEPSSPLVCLLSVT